MLMRRMGAVVAFLVLSSSVFGDAKIVVELIPDNPGPYVGGESITVDVWLHSQIDFDILLDMVRFDFTDTDSALSLDPTFTFDFSSVPNGSPGYGLAPELPVPLIWFQLLCVCPESWLPLPGGGSLHIGSIGVEVAVEPGTYRLDALNADESDEELGAKIGRIGPKWRAFTGEVAGDPLDFVVVGPPPIPTLSGWGIIAMTLLLVTVGACVIDRRAGNGTLPVASAPLCNEIYLEVDTNQVDV